MTNKSTRGILNPKTIGQVFTLSRLLPSPHLAPYLEHYWVVKWNLKNGEAQIVQTIPFPSIHIAIENQRSGIHGIVTKKFIRRLRGSGRVFGVKFRPGIFRAFLKNRVSSITNKTISLRSVFGKEGSHLKNLISKQSDEHKCVDLFEQFLTSRLPPVDGLAFRLRNEVERISIDRLVLRAEQVALSLRMNLRSTQEAFSRYVGVSPKWVIRRYRLQEAAEKLAQGSIDLAELASQLGYFDQSHLNKDFKALVGKTPMKYLKESS